MWVGIVVICSLWVFGLWSEGFSCSFPHGCKITTPPPPPLPQLPSSPTFKAEGRDGFGSILFFVLEASFPGSLKYLCVFVLFATSSCDQLFQQLVWKVNVLCSFMRGFVRCSHKRRQRSLGKTHIYCIL